MRNGRQSPDQWVDSPCLLGLKTQKKTRPRFFFIHTKLELGLSLFIPELSYAQLFNWSHANICGFPFRRFGIKFLDLFWFLTVNWRKSISGIKILKWISSWDICLNRNVWVEFLIFFISLENAALAKLKLFEMEFLLTMIDLGEPYIIYTAYTFFDNLFLSLSKFVCTTYLDFECTTWYSNL